MARWKPPTYDPGNVGAFVAQSYGKNKKLAETIYKRLRSKGARFYLDSNSNKYARVTNKVQNQRPDGWGTSTEVAGGWWEKPNLDSSVWEIGQNEAGRYFARKPTLEQQMTPYERANLAYFDTKTDANVGSISSQYDDYIKQADQRGVDYTNANSSLQKLIQDSAGPALTTNQEGVAAADTATRRAQAQAAEAVASSAPQENYYKNMGAAARQAQANAVSTAKSKALEQRMKLVAKINESATERRTAKYEADQALKEAQARLRGQQLSFMGQLYGTQAGMANAQLQSSTSLANNASDNQTQQAIANLQASVDLATATGGGSSGSGGGSGSVRSSTGATPSSYQEWVKAIPRVMDGSFQLKPNPDYIDSRQTPGEKPYLEVATGQPMGWGPLISQGVDLFGPEYAARIAQQVINSTPSLRKISQWRPSPKTGKKQVKAQQTRTRQRANMRKLLYTSLVNAGTNPAEANKVANRYFGK